MVPTFTLTLALALQAGSAPTPSPSRPAPEVVALGVGELLRDPGRSMSGHERGSVWLRGASYKAAGGGDGFRFVPYLGSGASRNWPVGFRVARVTAGGEEVPLGAPTARLEGTEVTIERGPLEVAYRATPEGVEQTYVLDGLPAATGDVTVEVALDTDLTARIDGDGLRFEGPEGGVSLGGAVALDGRGGRLVLEAELDGDRLTYRVPAAFARAAGDALVIDPLISTFSILDLGQNIEEPDIAYESTGDTFSVVMTLAFSGADRDIFYVTLDGLTLAIVDQGFVELISGDAREPRNAAVAGEDRFVATYLETDPATGSSWIYSRARDTSAGSPWEVTRAVVGTASGVRPVAHDLGGEAIDASPAFAMAVWEERSGFGPSEIVCQRLDADGALLGPQIPIAISNPIDTYKGPAISKYAGVAGIHDAWWVAFAAGPHTGPFEELRAARIDYLGNVTDPASQAYFTPGAFELEGIDVSAAYTTPDSAEAVHFTAHSVQGVTRPTFLATRERGAITGLAETLGGADINDSFGNFGAVIANSGDRAAVAYVDFPDTMTQPAIVVSVVERERGGGTAVGERRTPVTPYSTVELDPLAGVSQTAGGAAGADGDVVFVWMDADPSGNTDLFGASFRMSSTTAIGRNFCKGAPNSQGRLGFLAAYGDNTLASPKSLVASDLPPNQFAMFVVSRTFGSMTPAGSQGRLCLAGSIGRYNGSIASSGPGGELAFQMDPTAIPQGVSLISAAAGETWGFQAWHRDANPGQTSNFTSGVQITF